MSIMAEPRVDHSGSAAERLSQSRAEFEHLFIPEDAAESHGGGAENRSAFPRSAIMKLLTKNGMATGLTLILVALFAARPAMAAKLLRYLPVSAITKLVVARFINAQGAKR
jgi:hypothetical protein